MINKISLAIHQRYRLLIPFVILSLCLILKANNAWALNNVSGEKIFSENCSGCHLMGKNIIRRSKNLKIKTLERNGLDNPEAIAKIALEGIGSMDGYANSLKEGEDKIVAIWILEQAQKAWTQG